MTIRPGGTEEETTGVSGAGLQKALQQCCGRGGLKEGEWGSYGLMSTESALGEDEKVLEKAGVDGCIAV